MVSPQENTALKAARMFEAMNKKDELFSFGGMNDDITYGWYDLGDGETGGINVFDIANGVIYHWNDHVFVMPGRRPSAGKPTLVALPVPLRPGKEYPNEEAILYAILFGQGNWVHAAFGDERNLSEFATFALNEEEVANIWYRLSEQGIRAPFPINK